MSAPTQAHREIQFASPLGPDVLLFYRMHGTEKLSSLFEFELDLLSTNPEIPADDVLGHGGTVRIDMPNGGERFFNGIISRFGHYGAIGEYAYYRATIRPWLWLLTRTTNCRIFQEKSVPDIVKQIFRDKGFSDFEERLSRSSTPREYCVQYRESDFNFISRLLEEEGIHYFFEHDNGKHTLVLADAPGAHKPVPGYETIPFYDQGNPEQRERDNIYEWSCVREVQPVRYVLDDFDFKNPAADLQVQSAVTREHGRAVYEIFDYPGHYRETGKGEAFALSRVQELQTRFQTLMGRANARGLAPGSVFKLTNHPREDQNVQYLVTQASYQFESDDYLGSGSSGAPNVFQTQLNAILQSQAFSPARVTPKPTVQGPQTAIVVGKAGEEIWTDEHGRVKLLFHWDREGKKKRDETCSCWVRVSHPSAGKGWGAFSLPRIGQEVIVDFIEGDPDQPIITGRVYNGVQKPPYSLPAEQTKSTFKTDSSKGSGGFNELRFEDKKGAEQVFIHAERNYDLRVKSNSLESVGNDRHRMVNRHEMIKIGGDQHETVTGDRNEQVDGAVSLKIGTDHQHKVGMKYGMEAGQEIHLKAGMNVVIEAGISLTLKAGGSFINIGPAGVAINGAPMLLLNSGGAAGSGSGCSPEVPKLPAAADNAKAGQNALPPTRPLKPSENGYSAAAMVMKQAAATATPFCEVCEQAKAG